MDDKVKSQKTTEVKEIVEEKSKTPSKKVGPLLIILIVLIVLFLIPLLGIVFFRINVRDISLDNNQKCIINKQVVCDTQKTDEDIPGNLLEVKNEGWALISAPEIKVSMEIPNDEIVSNKFVDTTLESMWTYSYRKTIEYDPKVLGTFISSLRAEFYPISVQDVVCGGNGCVNASYITINGYFLGDNRTLEYVSEQFETVQTDEENSIVGKMSTKWDLPVYEYKLETPGGSSSGYIVVKDGYSYQISYYINSQPTGTVTTANKILNSISFN